MTLHWRTKARIARAFCAGESVQTLCIPLMTPEEVGCADYMRARWAVEDAIRWANGPTARAWRKREAARLRRERRGRW